MSVNTKKVANRRKVRYQTLDEIVQDAERLCQAPVRTLGNRGFAEILAHLAITMHGSIDGSQVKIVWPVRMVVRLLRKRILAGELSPGFRHTRANDARVWSAAPLEIQTALEKLRLAVRRLKAEQKRGPHPALGRLTNDEWNTFHLRHAEMHMSFVVGD